MSLEFYKMPKDIAARKDLQASDKLVYAVILNSIGDKGYSWIGKIKIVEYTGLAGQTVLDSIKRLELAGLLIVDRRGIGKSNYYQTSPEIRPVQKLDQTSPEIRPEPVQKLDTKRKNYKRTNKKTSFSAYDGKNDWAGYTGENVNLTRGFDPDEAKRLMELVK